jgi:serine/threonine protein kinase
MERIPGTPDLRLGEALGAYTLESVLGEGAIGLVFKATQGDGGVVALKVLKKLLSRNEIYRQRFVREARVAQEVRHPHLVSILETGEANGYHYLAVAYVEGGSLEDRVEAAGPLPLEECVRLAAQIGAGLDALHAHGIVHRDVKPSNVMLDRGGAALTDFGLAKGPAYTVLTKPGQLMGTVDYIAPELIRGEEAGPPSDLYALGCVVYECLAGVPPFADRRLFEVAAAHLEVEPPDVSSRRSDVPPAMAGIVQQAMAKEPAKRPRTGIAFANLLRAAATVSDR